jgi:MOSC domain-containing protein YiiM
VSAEVSAVEIVQLLVSPVHRYAGRPADGAPLVEVPELVDEVEIRAGLGIVGDRYFGERAHRDAAVTVMAAESLDGLAPGADLTHTRRNVLLRGIDVDALVGSVLTLDSGAGPVRLHAHRPANPCVWMDVTLGEGGRLALRGKGGVRCEPLSGGVLRLGPVRASVEPVS